MEGRAPTHLKKWRYFMNRTSNYKLCQWEADDKVQRTDFNADNAKLDAAIKA